VKIEVFNAYPIDFDRHAGCEGDPDAEELERWKIAQLPEALLIQCKTN
jgi:hypothetical protein